MLVAWPTMRSSNAPYGSLYELENMEGQSYVVTIAVNMRHMSCKHLGQWIRKLLIVTE